MMLLETVEKRSPRHNLWLGGTTAMVAGFVNVCSVIAFFAFSSNVTGHVAIFAEEAVKGHWHQVSVVFAWLALFLLGAFTANLCATAVASWRPYVGRGAPLVLQLALLAAVGFYGNGFYAETLKETEYLVGVLVFSMGVQNGMVASVSNGLVKTTHLTGLFTDLGMELSMMLQRRYRDDSVRFKLKLHLLILAGYVVGGILGGFLFIDLGFRSLYIASAGLGCILVHDLSLLFSQQPLWARKNAASGNWAVVGANGSSPTVDGDESSSEASERSRSRAAEERSRAVSSRA